MRGAKKLVCKLLRRVFNSKRRLEIDCYECAHVDGSGSCKHNTKGRCTGNYCTKTAGKLASRWFEMRGCAPIDPLYAAACIDYDKSITIAHLGSTINQVGSRRAAVVWPSRVRSGIFSDLQSDRLHVPRLAVQWRRAAKRRRARRRRARRAFRAHARCCRTILSLFAANNALINAPSKDEDDDDDGRRRI